MVSLLQLDRNGRINVDNLLTLIAGSVDPVLADGVLEPVQVAQEKLLKDITDDLSKIYAGIEVPARPSGAQAALQVIQQYSQQPDIQSVCKKIRLLLLVFRNTLGSISSLYSKLKMHK